MLSSFDVIRVVVDLYVQDHQGKTHLYHPICQDRVQTLITDIQNCPFVQEPLCLMMNDEVVDPKTPVWNLLTSDAKSVDLRMETVSERSSGMKWNDHVDERALLWDIAHWIGPIGLGPIE